MDGDANRWVDAAKSLSITPLSHPETVLEFIDNHAGLFETCCVYPDLLAECASIDDSRV